MSVTLAVVIASMVVALITSPVEGTSILVRDDQARVRPGSGVNPVTGDFYSPCMKNTAWDDDTRTLSHEVDLQIVTSRSDLRRALEMGAYASVFGVGTKLAVRVDDAHISQVAESRGQFYVRVKVTGLIRRLKAPEPSALALKLLQLDPSGRLFAQACGDSFVSELEEGAEFFALLTHKTVETRTLERFLLAAKAAGAGGEAGTRAKREVEALAKQFEISSKIMQIGVGRHAVASLTDAAVIIEYAQQFTDKVEKTKSTKPYRVHLTKYSSESAFLVAMTETKMARLVDFDDSMDVMSDIVAAYDVARERALAVAHALSNPALYRPYDRASLSDQERQINTRVTQLAALARGCATESKAGKSCARPNTLVVPPISGLERLAICELSQAQRDAKDGCRQVRVVDGQCRCVKCQFLFEPLALRPQTVAKVCADMPPAVRVKTTYSGSVGVQSGNIDGWYYLTPGSGQKIGGSNQPLSMDFESQDLGIVAPDGNVNATLRVEQCQSNTKVADLCVLRPTRRPYMIDIDVVTP